MELLKCHGGGVNKTSKRNFQKFRAFTLAEVLITLTIIGIVASMTIPLVTASHKKIEYSAKLKKFYNTMAEVIEQAELDYNVPFGKFVLLPSTTKNKEFFETYLASYIKYTKIASSGTTNFKDPANENKTIAASSKPVIYLDDGTSFLIYSAAEYDSKYGCRILIFDVNGDGNPNEINRDQYFFHFCGDLKTDNTTKAVSFLGLYPSVTSNRSTLLNACKQNYDDYKIYGYCTALIKLDGWEFKDDYPLRL